MVRSDGVVGRQRSLSIAAGQAKFLVTNDWILVVSGVGGDYDDAARARPNSHERLSQRHPRVQMSSLAQRVGRNPLPAGTLAVGAGLVLAGVAQYGFLAVSARALGPAHYSPLATFWALLFVCGPGFFLPLEQEVGRALSARRALGQGAGRW